MLNRCFLSTVSSFIKDKNLLSKDKRYLVALSGGADSVALLLTMLDLGYHFHAAHCNFHLRGEESDRDEAFCRDLCSKYGIELHVAGFDTQSFADLHKVSIEMAARKLRYSYFRNLISDLGLSAICVAHHKGDSVETVLLNLIRGTGIHGLTGILPLNGDVVRPLLCVSRHDIETVLGEAGQDFVTDSTDLVDDVVRNKIRLGLLPLMRKINPSVEECIISTTQNVAEAVNVVDHVVEADAEKVLSKYGQDNLDLSIPLLSKCISPESVLHFILNRYSFNSAQVWQIYKSLTSNVGKVFYSSTHQLLIDRNKILIEPLATESKKNITVPCDGLYCYDENTKFRISHVEWGTGSKLKPAGNILYADASLVSFPLVIRTTVEGDRFVPFGMNGSKLVSDFLTDRKVNLFDKQRQLVVSDSKRRIIWVVNQRPDNRVRVKNTTTRVLMIELVKQ